MTFTEDMALEACSEAVTNVVSTCSKQARCAGRQLTLDPVHAQRVGFNQTVIKHGT